MNPNNKKIIILAIVIIAVAILAGVAYFDKHKNSHEPSPATTPSSQITPTPSNQPTDTPTPDPDQSTQQQLNDLYGHTD